MTHLKVLCTLWSTGSAWRINTTQCPLENCHLQQMDGAGCHQDPEEACPTEEKETCFLHSLKQKENILEFFLIKEGKHFLRPLLENKVSVGRSPCDINKSSRDIFMETQVLGKFKSYQIFQ